MQYRNNNENFYTMRTLANHPTLVNDIYKISERLTNGSRHFRSFQGIMNHYYKADNKFQGAIIDEQIDAAIASLKEAAKQLETLKKNYKVYASEL